MHVVSLLRMNSGFDRFKRWVNSWSKIQLKQAFLSRVGWSCLVYEELVMYSFSERQVVKLSSNWLMLSKSLQMKRPQNWV
ncbi:hypothetical protein FGO68_gene628 [Halteria grandinella]|uniref:Uncharacterized protein n=1 Tax=Halteria grandinella TaxID=5974 RepID=A0A8J8NX13_HALGN|nr:hypothetical protein FGO68_gene628 [Halteria grandinella]